jgi:adenylyltransferase/sulfurtransferase
MTLPGRYARQTLLPGFGIAGQAALARSRVAIVGCGATGTVLANHLARAGVGALRLIDRDWVEPGNLQRQILYDEADALERKPKAVAAADRLGRVNSEIEVEPVVMDLDATSIDQGIHGCDLALDGTDNFETRYVLNDACVQAGIPWIYIGAVGTYGMTMSILPRQSPCLRCVFPTPPAPGTAATCDTAGVLGPAVSVVASLAASEALKWLIGARDEMVAGLTHVDTWDFSFHTFNVHRRPECECCVQARYAYLQPGKGSSAAAVCGRDAVRITPAQRANLDLEALAARLLAVGPTSVNRYLLRVSAGALTISLFRDGTAVVEGTTELTEARSAYAKYIGL